MFLLACLLLELKPFPANGWGLDVYETARSDVAALISGGVSAGVFFALLKLLPLFDDQLELIAALSAVTFLFSNLIGLQQTKAQRLLGYSSIGQMGLMTLAVCLLQRAAGRKLRSVPRDRRPVRQSFVRQGWAVLAGGPCRRKAPAGLVGAVRTARSDPPVRRPAGCDLRISTVPGFWAKWQLVLSLAAGERYVWIAIVLVGSLLEAAYLFRWFGQVVHSSAKAGQSRREAAALLPVFALAALLTVSGCFAAILAGIGSPWVFVPLAAGLVLYLFERLDARVTGADRAGGGVGRRSVADPRSVRHQCAIRGSSARRWPGRVDRLPRTARPPSGLLSASRRHAAVTCGIAARPPTSLEFFFIWELITLSSYFLILRRREAAVHALRYLLFSLVAAFFLLVGFALMHAATGSISLATLRAAGPDSVPVFVLLAIGLLIKAGAVGVHVWLPGAYAEADDDVSALLSAVVSKASMFGLLIGTYLAIRSEVTLNLAYVLGWIGDADHARGRHAGRASGRHEAHAGLFEHEPAWLHHGRDRADEPSRLGHRALSRRQSRDGERDSVPCRRGNHSTHRPAGFARPRRTGSGDAAHVRRCGRCDCRDVGAAAARRLRRKVAAAERDD